MSLVPDQEQRQLRDTARAFFAEHAPVAALRRLRDGADPLGYSSPLWRRMAELGWAGIAIPEAYGGLDFGFAGLAIVLEESGHTLAASPLFATCVLGASALLLGGSEAQKTALLPRISAGELCLALALEESPHHAPERLALVAARDAQGFRLSGAKQFVLDGHGAGRLLVAAGDDRLFLVDPATPGVQVSRLHTMDSRNVARIEFRDVRLTPDALLGEGGAPPGVLAQVLDRGRMAIAAEMLGGADECLARSVDYLKQREQFGVLIGSFQALQHRAAQMFVALELLRSVVRAAAVAVDEASPMLPLLASLAKAQASDCYELVTSESVQMHGGIGTTDELDIGLFLKRSRVCSQVFGDADFHRSRYATLRGF
jgi:acyl-CoA dehydrogenase